MPSVSIKIFIICRSAKSAATIARCSSQCRILDRDVYADVWELQVGRVKLYLLDTDIPENNAEDRLITAELYGGDLEMRMRQEIVLGIGGVKALTRSGSSRTFFT